MHGQFNTSITQARPSMSSPGPPTDSGDGTKVYSLIHELHTTITKSIDTSLSWDQLNSPPVNYTLVRPIVERLCPSSSSKGNEFRDSRTRNHLRVPGTDGDGGETGTSVEQEKRKGGLGMILYALMANRIQFINLASGDLSYAPLQTSRAAFCELLACKVLRTYPSPEDEADFVGELVRGWCAFDGAPEDIWEVMGEDRKDVEEMKGSALELAIVSNSKHFLSLPLIQHLVRQIYLGHLVYSPQSSRALISDSYISDRTRLRRRPSHSSLHHPQSGNQARDQEQEQEELAEVYTYNPYESGWLDHQRLRVPKWRKWLDFTSFGILMMLFVATLALKELERVHPVEAVFVVVTFGFMLDEFAASKEHGWTVYSANISVFLLYLTLRIFGLASTSPKTSDLGFDILACAACILFPRLVFYVIRDNVVILALKGMIAKFVNFMGLTIVAFSGICFCLWTLGRGTWTVKQIIWLMLQIFLGSSYLGFAAGASFHPIFGPVVLIGYAVLCNILLITILISILSNEFADINANAQAEHLFQKVVKTVEGVKSDAIFSYLPPLNIIAFIVLSPLSYVCSPRTLHRINVFCIRLTSFPILIAISLYERWDFRSKRTIRLQPSASMDRLVNPGLFDSFLGSGSEILISSVFESAPPPSKVAATPPKASSVSINSDDEDEREQYDTKGTNRTRPDSPLAKIFGFGGTRSTPNSRPAFQLGPGRTSQAEVEGLKAELKDVRESQLRMEEMLSKMISGK